MKKIFLLAALAATLFVSACNKKTSEPEPQQPTIPVADENGLIESFTFQGNLNSTRRGAITVTTSGTVTATGTDRRGNSNSALIIPAGGKLEIAGLPLPTGNASRTISCWVHINGMSDNKRFISYGSPTNWTSLWFGL
jgi:hypothetical protein